MRAYHKNRSREFMKQLLLPGIEREEGLSEFKNDLKKYKTPFNKKQMWNAWNGFKKARI